MRGTVARLSLLFGIISAAQQPLNAHAQPVERRERAGMLIGAFITDRDSTTRLDSAAGVGTELDLEEQLGLESSTSVGRLGGYVWTGRRHRIDAAFFDLSRTSAVPIDESITFGDETFVVDSVVETQSDLSIWKADYTFAAVVRDRGFLGVTAGLYVADTSFELRERTIGQAESEDLTAPLPLFGLRGEFAVTERITLRGAVQWFAAEGKDVDGRLTDFYVGVDYGIAERYAVGLAYNRVSMNLRATEPSGFNGRLDWGYDGLLLYFKVDFESSN